MSTFFYGANHGHAAPLHSAHPPHAGRRRAARASHNPQHNNSSSHQAHQKQVRNLRIQKDLQESALEKTFRRDFDAARSFDLEDDELFCPFHLLTEDDLQSISSSGSDRSSLSSGSPDQSPLQPQVQPSTTFLLPPSSGNFPPAFHPSSSSSTKLHQPLAQRTRNAIPIVDPSTRAVASPPQSISPARQMQQQYLNSRRW